MAPLPPPPAPTLEAIYAAYVADADDGFRDHLGASIIGKECRRALWYDFRWVNVETGYTVDGKRTDDMPMTQSDIARAVPVYEELPGWWEDISGAREFDDLPARARDYVLRLEELAGAPVSCIGVGPGREQTIVRRDVLSPLS